jgi:hypothetical protein
MRHVRLLCRSAGRSTFVHTRSSAPITSRGAYARSGAASLKALTGGELDPTLLHHVFQGIADVTSTVADITASGADQAVAAAAADNGGGVFASLVTLTENAITGLHTVLNGTCTSKYSVLSL